MAMDDGDDEAFSIVSFQSVSPAFTYYVLPEVYREGVTDTFITFTLIRSTGASTANTAQL